MIAYAEAGYERAQLAADQFGKLINRRMVFTGTKQVEIPVFEWIPAPDWLP